MSTGSWLPLALVSALFYGLHNAFSRAASRGISEELGVIAVQVTAAVAVFIYSFAAARPVRIEGRSLGWAMAGGLSVGLASVIYFALLRKGATLSTMGPVVLAGTTIVTTLAGVIAFGEKVTALRIVGLLLATGGIALLSRR